MAFKTDFRNAYSDYIKIAKKWHTITPEKKDVYLNQLRKKLNALKNEIKDVGPQQQQRNIKIYNNLVDEFNKKLEVPLEKITNSKIRTKQIVDTFNNRLLRAADNSDKVIQQKIELLNNADKAYSDKLLELTKPRVTLINVANTGQKQANSDITKIINKNQLDGKTFEENRKDVVKALEKTFPDGRTYYKDKNGKTRAIPLGRYAETWVKDMNRVTNTQTQFQYAKDAQLDLVKLGGGITKNPICDPYVRLGTMSISGNNPNYPAYTDAWEHINCSKFVKVSPANFTEENEKINDEIFGS